MKFTPKEIMHKSIVDCTGKRFGQVIAKKYLGSGQDGAVWLCVCDCGEEVIRTRSTFVDNEKMNQVTRCSRNCTKKNIHLIKKAPAKKLKLNFVMN